jgi:hypothetical protein
MKLYKLLESNGYGYFNLHTGGLDKKTAEEMRDDYAETFPDSDWIIEEDNEYEKRSEFRNVSRNVVDGWEDMYPDRGDY